MPTSDLQRKSRGGFGLDVWCDHQTEIAVLRGELAATSPEDTRRAALLCYELGRIHLAAGNEPASAEALLRSYSLRPLFRPTLRLARLLYRERSDFRLVIKLLDAEARATRDPLARAALLRQQARLLWSRLNDPHEARAALEEAYRLDVTDLATLKFLQLFYAATRDTTGLRTILERQLESVADPGLRTALLVELSTQLLAADPAAAALALQAAERNEPRNLLVLSCLEGIYEVERRYPELARSLVAQAEIEEAQPAWRAKILARAARIHRDQLGDLAGASTLFGRSLEALPLFGVAVDTFDLLLAQERYPEAALVGEELFDLDDTPSFRAAIACQVADIYRDKLNDRQSATTWYSHCLRWAPTYQPALEGLGWVLEEQGEVDHLLVVHRSDLGETADPHALAQRLYRIAALLERHGRDPEALEIHREALAANPGFKPSLSALERLFYRLERWTELLQLLDGELGRNLDRERVIHILETMGAIWYHQLHHADNALECYRRILSVDPDNLNILSATARLCAETRRWHDLVEISEREIKLTSDPLRRTDLLQRTGEVWEDNLLNLEQAIDCYERALQVDPGFLPALRALGRLHRQRGRWIELIAMHQAEIRCTSDPEQVIGLLYDVAEVYEEELLDERQAAATYLAILERRPDHLPAITALGRILAHQSEWLRAAELMESSLDATASVRGKALMLWRAGLLREDRLGDRFGAIKNFSRALRLSPHLSPVEASLAHALEESGDHHQLVDLYQAALEETGGASAITFRLAHLWEHTLDNPRKAALLYQRAVERDPAVWTLWPLAGIYERLGLHQELCGYLEQLAGMIHDERMAAEIHLRIGRIHEVSKLGDPLPYLARARDLPAGRIHAQRAIERHLRQGHPRHALTEILLERLERTKDPVELACLWTELAEINLVCSDSSAAETAYREALSQAPGHLSALWGLGRLLEEQERWVERATLAEREADTMESTRGLAEALFRAGSLWEERVGDVKRAMPIYRRVLKIHPGHPEAFDRLGRLLAAEEDWWSLASLIRTQITATTDAGILPVMFADLGRIYLDRLGQPQKGMACLVRVLDLEPENLYALTSLGHLHHDASQWEEAARMYERALALAPEGAEALALNRRLGDVYLSRGQAEDALRCFRLVAESEATPDPALFRRIVEAAEQVGDRLSQVNALARLAELSGDREEQVEARRQIARLAEESLEDDELAIRALEEILALDPLDLEAIERLASIYGRASNRSAVSQHLQAAVEHHRAAIAREPFAIPLYRQLGRVFQWQRQFDRLFCSCLVQSQLGGLEDVEARFFREHHRRSNHLPRGHLPRSRYELLVLPEPARGAAHDLLAIAGLSLQKRAATSLDILGLDRSSRMKPDHPLRAICDEMAGLLGGLDFEIWIARAKPDLVAAEMLSKPALILGSRVATTLLTPLERFRIGRALFLIAENALVLRDLSVRQIRILFVGLARVALPARETPVPARDEALVAEEARTLIKLLGRRDRKALGVAFRELGPRFAEMDLGEFARALYLGANRAGLVIAGDAKIGLAEAAQQVSDPHGPEMADLLQYLVSEEYFALRLELGLAPRTR